MNHVWYLCFIPIVCGLVACGNKGQINFVEDGAGRGPDSSTYQNAGFNLVAGSQALMVESGKTTANGYHAKVQLNEQKGISLSGGGLRANIKFTTRTRSP